MKTKILPAIVIAIILSSCSSAYRSAQTPDDLYYSPAKEVTVSTESETRKEKKREEVIKEEDYSSYDDRYIRMKIANRKWSSLDDYAYWNDIRYSNSCNCTCNTVNFVWFDGRYYPVRSYGYSTVNNPFSPYGTSKYYSWNNPYYYPVTYVKTVASTPSARPSRSLVETYGNKTYDNKNRPVFEKGRTIYSSESESNQGSLLKRVFTSGGTQTERASRTFETPNSNSSTRSNSTTTTNSNSSSGNSAGYNSTGTSTSTSRPPRKQ